MRPIQDIAELKAGHVLYHSAFGFARVQAIREADVQVVWDKDDRNLPRTVSRDSLRRVYSLCRPDGFFERALLDANGLREQLQVDPLTALELMLADLAGPQSTGDVQEWLVTLDLVPEATFAKWWRSVEANLLKDKRFRQLKGLISLNSAKPRATPARQLEDPLLTPARRLDLALELRPHIGDEAFRAHAVAAWRAGSTQVRELAFQALAGHHPNLVLAELLGPGPDNAESLIHAMRRSGWSPDQFDPDVLDRLCDRIREGARETPIPEPEGRLAASLARWWPDGGVALLVELARDPGSQPLVKAALDTLPDARSEALLLSLLARAIDENYRPAAGWLGFLLLDATRESPDEIAARVEGRYALIARWLRENMPSDLVDPLEDDEVDAPLVTMEVELVPLGDEDSMALADLPRRSGRSIVGLAAAIADALAQAHRQGHVINPTSRSFLLQLDGSVELRADQGDPESSPRPAGEPPSQRADVYAAAVLLVEAMLGRVWPRNIAAERVLPYLRHIIPDLPAAALAPFDQALHPDPAARPASAASWLRSWAAVGGAEARRTIADGATARPLVIGYDTHIGLTKMLNTQTNQDALAIGSRDGVHLLAVCDGISTANTGSGDMASGITASVLSSLWEQNFGRLRTADDFSAEAFIERALALANRAVCQQALQIAEGDLYGRVPMGTTVVVALIRGSRVQLGWLGDSRAYLVGPYGASLLTADMNQAGDRLRGWYAGHDMQWDPAGYALVGYIGHFAEDMRAEPLVPGHLSFTLLPGERLVLCTDGVTDYVAPHHPGAAQVVFETVYNAHPADAAVGLTACANRGGGGDNCTAVVATLLPAADDATEELSE